MKIAITGGAGFIGSHLAKAYLDAGHDVLIIDTLVNGSRDALDPRARFYQLDIRDSQLQNLLQRERPDIVSHHAAYRSQTPLPLDERSLLDADIQVRGLLNVLDSCVAASVNKIIFASGGNDLYGRPSYVGQRETTEQHSAQLFVADEETPLCPQKPCDITKVAGEGYVRYYTRHYGLSHTILRYADVYGEKDMHGTQHPLTYFTRMLLEQHRPTIRGAADAIRDHIFIDDVVRANLSVLARGHNQTLHISSGQGYSSNALFAAVATALQSDLEPLYLCAALVPSASCVLDNTQASLALGWRPTVDLSTGVRWAIERFCVAQGWEVPVGIGETQFIPSTSRSGNQLYLVGTR